MAYLYAKRGCGILVLMAMVFFFFAGTLIAKSSIVNHTGTVKITRPDGTTLMVEKGQLVPEIPLGSTIEIVKGSVEIEPSEGFFQVVIGGSAATVGAGDMVIAGLDSETAMADFEVVTGQISIITGNTTTLLNANQEAWIGFDKRKGIVQVKSIKGAVETITVGVKALIPQGGIAKINVDAKARKVHVESVNGDIAVTSVSGKVIMLAMAKSIDTAGSAEGEIQTFEEVSKFEPVEEPPEPERPEGSPHA
jgi:hypothetical protein